MSAIRPDSERRAIKRRQHGAALATSLLFLVIMTLLGLAAMRSGTIGLRLSQNEGSRLDAQQNAQTLLEAINSRNASFTVLPGSDYIQSCVIGSSLSASKLSTQQGFSCPSANADTALLPATHYSSYLYGSVRREAINGGDFAPVTAMREGDSGDRYDYALFTVTAGYDRVATTDDEMAQGGAEIAQGVYVKVARVRGLTQQ